MIRKAIIVVLTLGAMSTAIVWTYCYIHGTLVFESWSPIKWAHISYRTEPRWNPDGNELFYRRGEEMWSVAVTTEPAFQPAVFQPGRPTLLFEGSFELGGLLHNYDVSPDGERFVMVQSEEASATDRERLHVVLHWLDELERRVPVN